MAIIEEHAKLIEKYGHLFYNTAGNDVFKLLDGSAQANCHYDIRPLKESSMAQLILLIRLQQMGLLK